ncbi:RNA-binding Musashi homolog 1-like [Olea europaea subsp. europaea]|uniref:RNA-binding Musashi homolog 1-like n=1 Tax=Olea europaea subsp. europaea TaxID=158383 RepID=A0A8S0USU0_OLEEU|nr:RNA-binding Musashi homolog 1-like [Olea europaea subsp. europaea]
MCDILFVYLTGLHVVLIMFTGYLIGYAAFRALFSHSPGMSAAGGILGLVGGMLVEAFLFIIRTSSQDLQPRSSTLKIKKNQ